jgi:hypothetical protein
MQQRGLDWPGCFQDQARYAQRIPVVWYISPNSY